MKFLFADEYLLKYYKKTQHSKAQNNVKLQEAYFVSLTKLTQFSVFVALYDNF